ncbi:MAG: penicillin-binding transpeptidase domain-containing protein, partial [Dehalococcoidia bacterium]
PDTVTLTQALALSCHTAFARLAAERLGSEGIASVAKAFGFGEPPELARDDRNATGVAASQVGEVPDASAAAMTALGQRDVRMTPLQGALVAAAIANNGTLMRPYLVEKLTEGDRTVHTAEPQTLRRAVTPDVAAKLRDMMSTVVADGVGRDAQVDGADIGGMPGVGQTADGAYQWFIGYAAQKDEPRVAVAVVLEGAKDQNQATLIGGAVMRSAL